MEDSIGGISSRKNFHQERDFKQENEILRNKIQDNEKEKALDEQFSALAVFVLFVLFWAVFGALA